MSFIVLIDYYLLFFNVATDSLFFARLEKEEALDLGRPSSPAASSSYITVVPVLVLYHDDGIMLHAAHFIPNNTEH